MNIGKFRHRVKIQSLAENPHGDNHIQPIYSDVAEVWADVLPVSGKTEYDSKSLGESITHTIAIRYRSDITSENWLLWRGRRFRIRKVKDHEERRRFLILDCEEASAEGAYIEE